MPDAQSAMQAISTYRYSQDAVSKAMLPWDMFNGLLGGFGGFLAPNVARGRGPSSMARTSLIRPSAAQFQTIGGAARFVASPSIVKDTAIQLSQAVTTKTGQTIPAGSIVTESGRAIEITTPSGVGVLGRTSDLIGTSLLALPGTNKVDVILMPNGNFVGAVAKGATPNIRTVSANEFSEIKRACLLVLLLLGSILEERALGMPYQMADESVYVRLITQSYFGY